MQRQKAASAYFTSKQILHFAFAERSGDFEVSENKNGCQNTPLKYTPLICQVWYTGHFHTTIPGSKLYNVYYQTHNDCTLYISILKRECLTQRARAREPLAQSQPSHKLRLPGTTAQQSLKTGSAYRYCLWALSYRRSKAKRQ